MVNKLLIDAILTHRVTLGFPPADPPNDVGDEKQNRKAKRSRPPAPEPGRAPAGDGGQNYSGGDDARGGAADGSEWTSGTGAGWDAAQASRRPNWPPISPDATGTSTGVSLAPVIQRSRTATARNTRNAITGPSSGQAATITQAAQVGRLLIA